MILSTDKTISTASLYFGFWINVLSGLKPSDVLWTVGHDPCVEAMPLANNLCVCVHVKVLPFPISMWVYFSVCSVWTTFMLTTKWIIVETSLADYIQCLISNNQRCFSWICLYSQKPKIVTKTWKPIIYVDLKIISRQWAPLISVKCRD